MAVFRAPMLPADKALRDKAVAEKVRFIPPTVDYISGSVGAEEETVRFSGLKSLEANILAIGPAAMAAATAEMANIAADVIDLAKANYVPFRSGRLWESGHSDPYEPDRNGVMPTFTQIAMWFGGPATREMSEAGVEDASGYAEIQHEDLEFYHPIGGPKYLERPFLLLEPTFIPRIHGAVEAVLVGSGRISDLGEIEAGLESRPDYPSYGTGE